MAAQFQYLRLQHQADAVDAIEQVFADVHFAAPVNAFANPVWNPLDAAPTLRANIERLRAEQRIEAGQVQVSSTGMPALQLDVLMETGTGKTFTFIETIHRLHRRYGLSKFIVLVPSNAIRQGTLKSLQTTAAFFAREYDNQKISVVNYSDKAVSGFIHGANRGIHVMVSTYQSFAGDSRVIHRRGVEANLFGKARSYMEGLAQLRPVLIIDEPHRFEGARTQEYLSHFKPLMTLRFGATYKRDEYINLVYTLDSLEAFRQRLVKGITVDTVGTGADMAETLTLTAVTGTARDRGATVRYHKANGKPDTVTLHKGGNLGQATGLAFLDGHVVERITRRELLFTNGLALPLEVPIGYGMLAEEVQSQLIARAVSNHFEREPQLFAQGIKALTLFFIDAVHKYLPDGERPATVRKLFEQHYRSQLAAMLGRDDLDPAYRAYLERSTGDIGRVHKGYFARSHSEKGEEEAIRLILKEKESLLSFDTDLRFVFSMWALQEGWDNPNVFTLCKLAPGNSRISKLQQIGRGLRLAVNQQLERISSEDPAFDAINDLIVVVPASEGDFVRAIQSEISAGSLRRVSAVFDDKVLADYNVATSTRQANKVLDALEAIGLIALDDDSGQATLLWQRAQYQAQREVIVAALKGVPNLPEQSADNMLDYLDRYYEGSGQVKEKRNLAPPMLTINAERFEHFRELWENINRDAVLHYKLDSADLIESAVTIIEASLDVKPLAVSVSRSRDVQRVEGVRTEEADYRTLSYSVFTLVGFVRELANSTRLSVRTVSEILRRLRPETFAMIRLNENRALAQLRDLIIRAVHALVVNKVSYALREIRVQTALTDREGRLLDTIPAALAGSESHAINNPAVLDKSLYDTPMIPVDSQIERTTTDESSRTAITVFAKLPRVKIPTPLGEYNPDFGYVLKVEGKPNALFLVVETKGYDTFADVPERERWKIASAEAFFSALREQHGVKVDFKRKLNGDALGALLAEIDPQLGA
ncbi:DEAD/DEAH box helicase family protein [Denitratimonas sp. CY0512]|uniref:restriction endonuclease n=1 Tax=Denitratimonas sp. CY0512 TaxID=3131940 RepID=UPI0030B0CA74